MHLQSPISNYRQACKTLFIINLLNTTRFLEKSHDHADVDRVDGISTYMRNDKRIENCLHLNFLTSNNCYCIYR